ncbi:hypothetical protein GOODEAATRI_033213, partial [Goodea atripinnis]
SSPGFSPFCFCSCLASTPAKAKRDATLPQLKCSSPTKFSITFPEAGGDVRHPMALDQVVGLILMLGLHVLSQEPLGPLYWE